MVMLQNLSLTKLIKNAVGLKVVRVVLDTLAAVILIACSQILCRSLHLREHAIGGVKQTPYSQNDAEHLIQHCYLQGDIFPVE